MTPTYTWHAAGQDSERQSTNTTTAVGPTGPLSPAPVNRRNFNSDREQQGQGGGAGDRGETGGGEGSQGGGPGILLDSAMQQDRSTEEVHSSISLHSMLEGYEWSDPPTRDGYSEFEGRHSFGWPFGLRPRNDQSPMTILNLQLLAGWCEREVTWAIVTALGGQPSVSPLPPPQLPTRL